ncbi:MAG: hypothetical protein AMS22_09870 [Thiotrichales bacterium SG8_50]|nr:MAG: hypothetical protein AMS22_09870 [Thiotrichales bacterium SG8_50]
MKDGLSGTANIAEASPGATDTDTDINTVNLNSSDTQLVPVGARFTVNTVNNTTVYTVTARTPTTTSPTNNIEFTPAWGANTPAQNDVITFQSQQMEVTVGEGNVTWTESKEYEYLLDRGDLDTVREGDEQPLEVSLEFVYEQIKTGTGETVTAVDAVKGTGGAAEWVSSSSDLCEPYAVDMRILHCVPCGNVEDEDVVFPDFRWETLEFDLGEATIAVTGRCNASEATITRSNNTDCS